MAEKNLLIPDLLDIYGCLLTPRQRMLTEYYYCDDLSLGEIAENEGISRQGARDFIKKAEEIGYTENNGNVKILEYIDNMDVMLAAADLVISRAGAMSVNELQVCGKPSILIPSPFVAENHQFHNAMSLKKVNAAEILEEKDLDGESLLKKVNDMLFDDELLNNMSVAAKTTAITDADRKIAEIILNLAKK